MLRQPPRIAAIVLSALAALTLITPLAARQAAAPPYKMIATLDRATDGNGFSTFAFDAKANRLYMGSLGGLFWVDLSEKTPRIKGPSVRKRIVKIEFAPGLQKIFYATADEVGYADLDRFGESKTLVSDITPRDIVYEPTRKELYVATRDPRLLVFDAVSGRAGDDVQLPGWFGTQMEAMPGRVFVLLEDKQGLYVIDAATHHVAEWPVTGRLVTPAFLEADPAGEYSVRGVLSRARGHRRQARNRDRQRRYANDAGHRVRSRRARADRDVGRRRSAAVQDPRLSSGSGRIDEIARLENPRVGISGVEPTNHGFVQSGHLALLVWSSQPGQMFQLTASNRQK